MKHTQVGFALCERNGSRESLSPKVRVQHDVMSTLPTHMALMVVELQCQGYVEVQPRKHATTQLHLFRIARPMQFRAIGSMLRPIQATTVSQWLEYFMIWECHIDCPQDDPGKVIFVRPSLLLPPSGQVKPTLTDEPVRRRRRHTNIPCPRIAPRFLFITFFETSQTPRHRIIFSTAAHQSKVPFCVFWD